MKLRTPLCDLLGIEYPVLQAAMGLVAYAPLAAAVSEAGGLGCVAATAMTPDQIRDEIRKVRSLTSRPFAVNVLLPENDMPFVPGYSVQEQVEVVLDERVPIWSTGLGSPKRWLAEAHRRGIKVISSVGTVRAGVAVAEAGVDAVVAQGQEAGGHVGTIGTFVLVPAIVQRVQVPVVAGGGIADGFGLAGALALGAQGAWVGTRFAATEEVAAHPNFKAALVRATEEDTTLTRAFTGKRNRCLKNSVSKEWQDRTAEIQPYPEQFFNMVMQGHDLSTTMATGNVETGHIPVGQAVGLVHGVLPAAEVVRRLVLEAQAQLVRLAAFIG